MNLSNYKACLFDLDKTLTNFKQEVTPATAQALKKLSQKMKIGLCTGRHFATLTNKGLTYFAPEDTHIVSGGSQVITSAGKVLWQKLIPIAQALELVGQLDNDHIQIYFQTKDQIFGNQVACDKWQVTDVGMNKKPLTIDHLRNFPDEGVPIIVMHNIDQTQVKFLSNLTDMSAKIMTYYAGHPYADILAKNVTKVTGLKKWCQINGIKPAEIIGFGDSENDEEFLTHVGYAVAMGNAVAGIKKIADEVIGGYDEDGVAGWINENAK